MSKLTKSTLLTLVLAACGPHQATTEQTTALALTAGTSHAKGTWFLAGSDPAAYQMSGDPASGLSLTSSTAPAGEFGTAMIATDPAPHAGKRVRLSATVHTTNSGWAGLWMRVDGAPHVLAFDNMQNRPLTGTAGPTPCSVVLDVSASSTNLAYGVLLVGPGDVEVSDLQLQEVDTSVAVTNLMPAPGWFLGGTDGAAYSAVGDPTTSPGLTLGTSSATPDVFGTVMTQLDAAAFASTRVKLSAQLGAAGITGWAGLWLRADDLSGHMLVFDNMQNRPVVGTAPADSAAVVLDIPGNAAQLSYGALLAGSGQLTVSTLTLVTVDASVPTTN